MSAVGYDYALLPAFTDPPLTTMRQHVAALSRHAVGALLDDIHSPQPRRELLFPTEPVVRGSTGPPRTRPTAVP